MKFPDAFAVPERALLAISGTDARSLLQNVITGGMTKLTKPGEAIHSGLLTPQGKILFAFFVVQIDEGFLIDVDAPSATGLKTRLQMYKLRSDVAVEDGQTDWTVGIALPAGSEVAPTDGATDSDRDLFGVTDPRSAALGHRIYTRDASVLKQPDTAQLDVAINNQIVEAIPEFGRDYETATTFPHEANWDREGSVDFKKGCYIGQEVVSRMHHKAVVRKRFVTLRSAHDPDEQFTVGSPITAGRAKLGQVTSVSTAGDIALGLIRLDRAVEALDGGDVIHAGEAPVVIATETLNAYREAASEKQAANLA